MTRFAVFTSRRFFFASLVALMVVAGLYPVVWADPSGPTASDRQITLAVTSLVRREHLTRHPLDREISERCFQLYLKAFDPLKVYFYQSDVDQLMRYQDELGNMAAKGDISFAYMMFGTLLKRVDERVKMIDELLAMKHDFTVEEDMVTDRDSLTFAKTPAEAWDRWRKRIKYDLLVLKIDGTTGQEAVDKLKRRYHSFGKRMHQTDSDDLLEMYLTSLTTAFDPHTSYMSPRSLEDFEIQMKLELEGIGAALQNEDGYTIVHKIIPGGAADKDGRLRPKDKIVGVGQGPQGEVVDVVDMKLRDVVNLIRGKRGTLVRLQVVSAGNVERKVIDITRTRIELKDSEASGKVFEAGQRPDGRAYKVGVIDLPSFYMDMEGARHGLADFKSTTRDVRVILDNFNKQGVDAVVLDLRKNGGGSLTEAINLTGLFITEGPVVQVKDAEGRVQPYHDLDPTVSWSGPLVVLISKFSASASEILAGAIQDYGRGLIVGDRATHGKGTVQSLMDLGQQLFRVPNAPRLGALKITMQQFYRPSGDSTQKRGVVADVELPSLTSHLDVGEADLDYPLEFDRVEPAQFKRLGFVEPAVVDRLKHLSQERCSHSEKFQRVLQNVARYKAQKARKMVTLNEEKFLKERAETNADKEEEKKFEELNEGRLTGIQRDYYLDEALAIATDYMNLRQVAKAN